jgi:hypothetical protein
MPERKNLHFVTVDPIVKIVVNSSKVDAPHTFRPCVERSDPDPRLRAEERKRFGEFFV